MKASRLGLTGIAILTGVSCGILLDIDHSYGDLSGGAGGAPSTTVTTSAGGAGGAPSTTVTTSAGGAGGASSTGVAPVDAGSDGSSSSGKPLSGPCDIYAAGGAPCVAAHSTTRALYGSYSGNLYQIRRASDSMTWEVGALTPGGVANSATQNAFCFGTSCTISIIYDQSQNGNHLTPAPPGGDLNHTGLEANATDAMVLTNGHPVYGVYIWGSWDNDAGSPGYRNAITKGLATGDEPEAMYMVVSGKHFNRWCCFEYGNTTTSPVKGGNAVIEAMYFGNDTQWGKGSGTGPWVMADFGNGLFAGGSLDVASTNTTLVANYVTAMLKGDSGNHFALKAGDAQSGTLTVLYDGPRPAGDSPQNKQGAVVLGLGGLNSHVSEGTFFEGAITTGVPSEATDTAVQANIVAAGYGH